MAGPPDEHLVMQGEVCTIAYAVDVQGRMPAKDFLESDRGRDAPTDRELAGLFHAFRVMADHGQIRNDTQFKREEGSIFGFKKYQARIAAFQEGRVWYLTHGFKKKKDKWPRAELERAKRIREEHLNRGKGEQQ